MTEELEPASNQQLKIIKNSPTIIPISFDSLDSLAEYLGAHNIIGINIQRNNYDQSFSFGIKQGNKTAYEAMRIYLEGVVLENIDFIKRTSNIEIYEQIKKFLEEKGFNNFYNPNEHNENYVQILNERFQKELKKQK